MKKWHKWTAGIVAVIVLFVVIMTLMFWSSFRIISGTENLNGKAKAIPKAEMLEQTPIRKDQADWICWRGAIGDGRSEVTGIIMDWSGGLKKRWEVNYLCQGSASASWSAPVIQGNRLIVCGRDTISDLIFCLDPESGGLLWQSSYAADANTSHGSGPRATPYIDDDRVYTFGRMGDLVCWNLLDGKKIWHKNIGDEGGKEPTWGHSSSPLVLDSLVLVQAGGSAGTMAYEKMSGEVIWKSKHAVAGYAALTTMNLNGTTAILAFHGKGLAALEAKSGSELWNTPWETDYNVNATTPIVNGDRVFITSGYEVGCQLLKVRRSKIEILWQNEKFASMHSDPYIIDDFIYGYSGQSYQNRGDFKCMDLKTGEEQWSTGEMGWGTCVFVDGYLLCCDIKGNIFLLKPNPDEFRLVTELNEALGDIKGPVWTTPIVANDHLYLRYKQKLVCYELTGDKSKHKSLATIFR